MTAMSNQEGMLNRIGRWIGISRNGHLPLEQQAAEADGATALAKREEPARGSRPVLSFLRPWARRDAAITSLQQGFNSLGELMAAIRENMEKQGRRQDEMLSYLAHLPEILQALPEAQRIQGETLRAIGQQLQQQIGQQTRLTEILAKVSETSTGQKEVLDSLHDQVQTTTQQNQAISESLRQVGSAMENVGQNSKSSSEILQHLRIAQAEQDSQVQRILEKQGTRFTIVMIIAGVVSLAALAAAGVTLFFVLRSHG